MSYAVGQLEEALGNALFDRGPRTPVLTEAGRRLASEARLVLTQARELTECAAQLQAGTEPELRVVVDAYYPRSQLVQVCEGFQEQFPSTSLRIEVGLLHDAVSIVAAGQAELGACNLAGGALAELAVAHLGEVNVVPTCAANHALARAQAPLRGPTLARSVQIVHAERAQASADQGVLGSRTWRVTDLELKFDLIRRGVGWGSLPLELAQPWLDSGELVRLRPEPWPAEGHRISLHAVVRRDRPLGRAGVWFRERLSIEPLPPSGARGGRSGARAETPSGASAERRSGARPYARTPPRPR